MFVTDGKVGVGTEVPIYTLDVRGVDAVLSVDNTRSEESPAVLFRLRNKGRINFNMTNTASGETWQFSATATGFHINETAASGGPELQVTKVGDVTVSRDLTVNGQLFTPSSRTVKDNLTPVDGAELLAKLAAVPIHRWTYTGRSTPHIGPLAEDFYAAFGVGRDDRTLSPSDTSGVALAAVREVVRQLDERDGEIARLEASLDEESARSAALEARLERLEAAAPAR